MNIELKNTKAKVQKCLALFPKLRDSDSALWIHIIRNEIDYLNMTGEQVLRTIAEGKCTNPESVRRCRQKVNESDPATRGKSWMRRQKKGVEVGQKIHLL